MGQANINPSGPSLQLGNATTPGITFTASATPPSGYSNNFAWVQINTNDSLSITLNNNTQETCTWATTPAGGDPYLDTEYPYATATSTDDSPSAGLDSSSYYYLSRNFNAVMYLMWTPPAASGCTNGSACTIPVPLGYVTWAFSANATYNSTSQQWTAATNSESYNNFQPSSTYASWARYSNYSTRNCN